MARAKFEFVVYIKDGCHLCDSLLEELDEFKLANLQLTEQVSFRIIDILDYNDDANKSTYARFHDLIPVIYYNQNELCRYYFDADAIFNLLQNLVEN